VIRGTPAPSEDSQSLDPKRWLVLAIAVVSAFIVVLDNTVLNVSIPTIVRDLHTTLPSLEWVITGYALTFAALLIIGGRLGDIYGHRLIFIIGAGLFCIGSLLASISTSVGELILGEAIIEGIGASFMLPTTLAILSRTFKGRERATAFAAWGATAGVAAAFGPVVGGFLTTNYSWRWSFRINVVVAPLAIIGALFFFPREARSERRVRIDIPGALLIAVGMFLLVFVFSEGGVYGWLKPIKDFSIGGWTVWPSTRSVSVIPLLFVAALVVLTCFALLETAKGRGGRDPLIEFVHFHHKTYRYGLLTSVVVAMGQLGLSFVLPIFLQNAKHLSAARNGLWMVPSGLFVIIGSQVGGLLTRRFGPTAIVRIGLTLYVGGLLLILRVINLNITAWKLLPGLALYGLGIGFAIAQLTNVVLSEVPLKNSGVAGGANSTGRQVGSALGVSVIGSILAVRTISASTSRINASSIAAKLKAQAVAGIHAAGSAYVPPASTNPTDATTVHNAIAHGVISGTRLALVFAVIVIAAGALMSLLIPRHIARSQELTSIELDASVELVPDAAGEL
jgi:EmrB/QacA subfamily drug resistance transporter